MMGELQDINSDLGKQLQEKDDQVRNLQTRIASIEIQVENSTASSKKAIAQLEGQVAQKDDEIGRLHAELLQTELSSKRNLQDHLGSDSDTPKLLMMIRQQKMLW